MRFYFYIREAEMCCLTLGSHFQMACTLNDYSKGPCDFRNNFCWKGVQARWRGGSNAAFGGKFETYSWMSFTSRVFSTDLCRRYLIWNGYNIYCIYILYLYSYIYIYVTLYNYIYIHCSWVSLEGGSKGPTIFYSNPQLYRASMFTGDFQIFTPLAGYLRFSF